VTDEEITAAARRIAMGIREPLAETIGELSDNDADALVERAYVELQAIRDGLAALR
jgi:hypothetical protein